MNYVYVRNKSHRIFRPSKRQSRGLYGTFVNITINCYEKGSSDDINGGYCENR